MTRYSLLLLLPGLLVGPAPAPAQEDAPLVTGGTVVTGTGHVGATVRVPEGTGLRAADIRVELTGVSVGYLAIGDRAGAAIGGDLCIRSQIRSFPDNPPAGAARISTPENGEIRPGLHDLYLLTDGTMRVRLLFRDLSADRIEVTAERPVAAVVERLVRRCPGAVDEDCEHLAYGGVTHELTPPALATVIGNPTWAKSGSAARCRHRAQETSAHACIRGTGSMVLSARVSGRSVAEGRRIYQCKSV